MIDTVLSYIAPHLCSGCGIMGASLCHNCKYDIVSESFNDCLACGSLTTEARGVCRRCVTAYERAWCVGERSDALLRLIEQYKFYRLKQAYKPLAALLDERLPQLPIETVIVPIPTLPAHIRQRGYDHMFLIAKELARLRHYAVSTSLDRVTVTKQLGASRAQRLKQAARAFDCRDVLAADRPYLIIDDVVTTGATLEYAARTLRAAGAATVWTAAVSRQSLKLNS